MRVIVMLLVTGSLAACREAPGGAAGDRAAGARAERVPVSAGPDPWEAARTRGIEFRALGQEPGWYLEIDEGTSMRLVYDYGEREATTPVPPPIVEGRTTIYEARTGAHRLRVEIEDRRCSDVMSGAAFPRTVTVTIDGSTYTGCGREL